jgi:hypothetical protein
MERKAAEFVFWPSSFFPWLAGLVAFAFLSLFGFQRLPLIDKPGTAGVVDGGYLLLGLIVTFNLTLFWQHVSPHYLLASTARVPWLVTFVLLSTAYLALYLFAIAPPLDAPDGIRALVTMSQLGVYVTLVTSQLWTSTKPGVEPVRTNHDKACAHIRSLIAGRTWETADKAEVVSALKYLSETAVVVAVALRAPADRAAIHKRKRGAAAILARIATMEAKNIAPSDIDTAGWKDLQC